jgi:hypothetical protein
MGLGEVASSRICTDIAVLYDYVQANAATMNFVKSLAKQLASNGKPLNAFPLGRSETPL